MCILRMLSKYFDRNILNISYKLYVRPRLDYGNVICHNQRTGMMHLLEQVQYKAALIVSSCWHCTNREKLYEELGWESLSNRRWCRWLCLFDKISNGISPPIWPTSFPNVLILVLTYETGTWKYLVEPRGINSFFPLCTTNWNFCDESVRLLPSISRFKSFLFNFLHPPRFSFLGVPDRNGSKWLTQIRIGFSDLREHRFIRNFNCEDPTCFCGVEVENSSSIFPLLPAI